MTVRNLETCSEFVEHYDELLIATGTSSIVPPWPGIDAEAARDWMSAAASVDSNVDLSLKSSR